MWDVLAEEVQATGPAGRRRSLYALVDRDDRHHSECRALLEDHAGPLLVPVLVITEVTYLIGTRLGPSAEVRLLGDLASGVLSTEPVQAGDWLRIAELVASYRDLPLYRRRLDRGRRRAARDHHRGHA